MTDPAPASAGPAALLTELARAPARDRITMMQRLSDPEGAFLDMAKHIEQLMLVDLPSALEGSAALMETADAMGGVLSRLRARRVMAQCFSYSNRFGDALTTLEEAAALAATTDQDRELALINMTRLHALARLGRFDEAVESGEAARRHLLDIGDAVTAAKADVNLGVVQRMSDRPAEAIVHFERARPVFADQPLIIAQIESNRAEALLDLHEFDRAEAAFNAALGMFQKAGAHRAAAIVEGNLADLMGRQGRMASALHHFENARRRLESEGGGGSPGDLARLEGESAEVQLQLGMLSEAADASMAAAQVLEEQGMAVEAARARMTLARARAASGDSQEAERVLLLAIAQFEAAGQPHQAARAKLALAELLCLRQDAGSAAACEDARAIITPLLPTLEGRPADAAAAHALLAMIELRAANPKSALAHTADGLKAAEALALPPLIARLLHLRGQALTQLGRADEALATLMRAADQIERIRGSLQADRFRIAFHAVAAPIYADAVTAALRSARADRTAVAFSLVERARSRALLDLLGAGSSAAESLATPAGEDPAEAELIAELARGRARLNALYTGLHESGGAAGKDRSGEHWQGEIAETERQLARLESRLASVSRFGELFAEPLSLEEARRHVPDGAALLEYFIAGGQVIVFALTSSGEPLVLNLCSLTDVMPALERLRFQISRAIARGGGPEASRPRALADTHRELDDLYRMLLKPALQNLTAGGGAAGNDITRLIIAPYGPLHALPFHALRDGDTFMIERYELLSIPSASILGRIGRHSPLPEQEAPPLLVGVADENAPGIADEIDALAALLPQARILRMAAATTQAVAAHAAGAPLVHIAAHGIFSGSAPSTSGVRLADGWLTAREICLLRLQGGIVALSGCETGRSAYTQGDELQGLVRSFLIAGARIVLGSLWPVHDQTATEMLVSTYRMWYLGKGPRGRGDFAAALRTTQIDFARRQINPAFWAPFFLVGTP
jgi:tetratricopeptide (TPR) repeat protein